MKNLVAASLVAVCVAFGCGCGETAYMPTTPAPRLVEQADPGALRSAILRGLDDRKFRAEGEEPGRVIASYAHGSSMVRVAVEYGAGQYALRYLQSEGYKTTLASDGSVLVEARCVRVMDKLDRAIRKEARDRPPPPPRFIGVVVPVVVPVRVVSPPPYYPPPPYAPPPPPPAFAPDGRPLGT